MRYLSIVGREMGRHMAGEGSAHVDRRTGQADAGESPRVAPPATGAGEATGAMSPIKGGGAGSSHGAAAPGTMVSVEQRVLQSNPILETFGNARTVRNENSSRFGKFIELQFDSDGQLVGARIQTYLLEKVRIMTQSAGERNYHAFYQLCKGVRDEHRKAWCLDEPTAFHYVNQSGLYTLTAVTDEEEYEVTQRALTDTGFSADERRTVFQTLAALLHLGNVRFEGDEKARVVPATASTLATAATLLGTKPADMVKVLTSQRIEVRGEVTFKELNPSRAADARDALVKQIYGKMFDWIVARVNDSIRNDSVTASFIGVLDIFGFESFVHNSFEQLCINYTNEQLQQYFNNFVFKLEQEEYGREGIPWKEIDFPDNQDCLDLIEARKPPGILSLLDETCLMPKGDDGAFARKCYDNFSDHPRFTASNRDRASGRFTVVHYAGQVNYATEGFCEKNKDTIPEEATALIASSSLPVVRDYFVAREEVVPEYAKRVQPSDSSELSDSSGGAAAASASSKPAGARKGAAAGKMTTTVGTQFRLQLKQLLSVLGSTEPHYIRCLKPNAKLIPREMERVSLVTQLRCNGVLEAVRVSRLGYPVRFPHSQFLDRYECLWPSAVAAAGDAAPALSSRPAEIVAKCRWLLEHVDGVERGQFQVGLSKIFFRKGAYEVMESRRTAVLRAAAVRAQQVVRGYLCRRRYARWRAATVRIQCASRGMLARRRAQYLRETRAATRLQAWVRAWQQRIRFDALRHAIISMQSALRGARGRSRARQLRAERCARTIQATYRGHVQRSAYLRQRDAAVRIQCMARSKSARDALRKLRREAREVGSLRDDNIALKARNEQLEGELAAALARVSAAEARALADHERTKSMEAELLAVRSELALAHLRTSESSARAEAMPAEEPMQIEVVRLREEVAMLRSELASRHAVLRSEVEDPVPAHDVDDDADPLASPIVAQPSAGALDHSVTDPSSVLEQELSKARAAEATVREQLTAVRRDLRRRIDELEKRVFTLTQESEVLRAELAKRSTDDEAAPTPSGRRTTERSVFASTAPRRRQGSAGAPATLVSPTSVADGGGAAAPPSTPAPPPRPTAQSFSDAESTAEDGDEFDLETFLAKPAATPAPLPTIATAAATPLGSRSQQAAAAPSNKVADPSAKQPTPSTAPASGGGAGSGGGFFGMLMSFGRSSGKEARMSLIPGAARLAQNLVLGGESPAQASPVRHGAGDGPALPVAAKEPRGFADTARRLGKLSESHEDESQDRVDDDDAEEANDTEQHPSEAEPPTAGMPGIAAAPTPAPERLRRKLLKYEDAIRKLRAELEAAKVQRMDLVHRVMRHGEEALQHEQDALDMRAERDAAMSKAAAAVSAVAEADRLAEEAAKRAKAAELAKAAAETALATANASLTESRKAIADAVKRQQQLERRVDELSEELSSASRRSMAVAQRLERETVHVRQLQRDKSTMEAQAAARDVALHDAVEALRSAGLAIPPAVIAAVELTSTSRPRGASVISQGHGREPAAPGPGEFGAAALTMLTAAVAMGTSVGPTLEAIPLTPAQPTPTPPSASASSGGDGGGDRDDDDDDDDYGRRAAAAAGAAE